MAQQQQQIRKRRPQSAYTTVAWGEQMPAGVEDFKPHDISRWDTPPSGDTEVDDLAQRLRVLRAEVDALMAEID